MPPKHTYHLPPDKGEWHVSRKKDQEQRAGYVLHLNPTQQTRGGAEEANAGKQLYPFRSREVFARKAEGPDMTLQDMIAILSRPSDRLAPCEACAGVKFWVSCYGVTTCGRCHPPASTALVAEWIEGTRRP
jgi:hypothetical protein